MVLRSYERNVNRLVVDFKEENRFAREKSRVFIECPGSYAENKIALARVADQ